MEPLRPEDPRQIGSYGLLARIGAGGMGEVFLGRSPGGRAVAIKVIHTAFANDTQFRARFAREVIAARAVTGAFTAPLVDADPEADQPWLATAFLPGMSLQDAIAAYGPWPPPAVYLLGASLAEALGSIHRAQVVHRDLKPSNILLTWEGPRVIDFGIARAADVGTITQTGLAVGSPSYMAPEQATGGDTGPPGDVFALGAVLTYAATGAAPFGTGSVPQLVFRVVHEQPYLDGIVDPGLRALIAECLDKDPDRRPTSGRLLERLLERLAQASGQFGQFGQAGQAGQPGQAAQAPAPAAAQGIGWLPPPVAAAVAHQARLPLPQPAPMPPRTVPPGPVPPGTVPPGTAPPGTVPPGAGRRISRRGLLIGGTATAATLAVAGTAAALWVNRPRSPILWSFEVPDYLGQGPIVAGNTVFVSGAETFALEPRDGKVRWRDSVRITIFGSLIADGGRCFLHDGSSLDAFNITTGERLWSEPIKTFAQQPVPVVANGVVCMTASPGVGEYVLYALDVATGKRRWQYAAENLIQTNAAAAGGVFYMSSGAELLYAIDAAGRLRWQQPVGDKIATTPSVAGGLVYVVTQRYEVQAFDVTTGKRRWRNTSGALPSSGSAPRGGIPTVTDGIVYVRGHGGDLRALDARTGRDRWTFSPGDKATSPIVASGLAVLHDGEKTVHALDTQTGKARWTQGVETAPGERPEIMNGTVYMAARDGVYGYDLATGRSAFQMTEKDFPGELFVYTSKLTATGGVLYCSVGTRKLYAIRPKASKPAK